MLKRNRNRLYVDESDEDEETIQKDQTNKKNRENDGENSDDLSVDSNKENDGADDDTMGSNGDLELIGSNLRINTANKSRSLHPIWDMFGKLEKNGKIIAKAKERIFCIHCFEKKKMKR